MEEGNQSLYISDIPRFCVNHATPVEAVVVFRYHDLNNNKYLVAPACGACENLVEQKILDSSHKDLTKSQIDYQIPVRFNKKIYKS